MLCIFQERRRNVRRYHFGYYQFLWSKQRCNQMTVGLFGISISFSSAAFHSLRLGSEDRVYLPGLALGLKSCLLFSVTTVFSRLCLCNPKEDHIRLTFCIYAIKFQVSGYDYCPIVNHKKIQITETFS